MYNHLEIEKKWAKIWEESSLYKTKEDLTKEKYYILDMFPYPSGAGLHVGHPKGYIATDIFARYKILKGFNVLHPMGWDAFGLPAENYAIKNKLHPRTATEANIKTFKRQLSLLGLSYDWEREIDTTDPSYYKWTQWIFLQMWKEGLAYESFEPINWCPSCLTGLANEDLEDGLCERCGSHVEQKPMRQWVLKITDYADRLLDDLDSLKEWDSSIKDMQRNWIGRSYGTDVIFKIKDSDEEIKVFTTRVDTIYGCSYLVLAPENKLIQDLKPRIKNFSEVEKYLKASKNKTELQRTDLNKDKTGVMLEGVLAENPFNKKEIKVFVADYVLNSYGTGAVMAVPAHDERDFEFAEKYDLEIITSVAQKINNRLSAGEKSCYTEDGYLVDSGEFSALSSEEARKKMTKYLEEHNLGKGCVNYKLKDWVFSRQRYWGEPIPLIHCDNCGVVPVPESELPLKLPEVDNYQPTGTGESPLAAIDDWVNTACPKCGSKAKRETNTMPQWGGSCWYYLRYIDPNNNEVLVEKEKEKYWSPVDFYVGGAEHATRHLIYARFWHKFLFDIGVVSYEEPFIKLQNVGLIIGEDGRKMSKRWGNVINPDDLVLKYGADSLRVYEMFMGPFSQSSAWSTNGLIGARKFLDKVDLLFSDIKEEEGEESEKILSLLHKTIKKVESDIQSFDFNTAISALMIFVNESLSFKQKNNKMPLKAENLKLFVQIISPFAPFLAEEIWQKLGEKNSVFKSSWPVFSKELAKDKQINLAVQVNGKLRATIEVAADISEEDAFDLSLKNEKVKAYTKGKEIVKKIFVKGRLVSLVVK